MNYYNRIRQHYKDLPELPEPDSDLSQWQPEHPQNIKDAIHMSATSQAMLISRILSSA